MNFQPIQLRAKGRLYPAGIAHEEGKIFIKFRFNRTILNEVKNMSGAKWHGFDTIPRKLWSVADNQRNKFQLEYLQGGNPYAHYDAPLIDITDSRPLFKNQIEAVQYGLTRKRFILAAEMGVGKTLAGIVIMEQSGKKDWWWVGPKSAIKSVELELLKWESRVYPRLLTYDALRGLVKNWNEAAPQGIVFDESARIKTPTAMRSQSALYVADAIRKEHDGYVILMTGTPAPKAPTDWWHQAEVACPGFLVEGDLNKFKRRLCLIEMNEGAYGNYPKLMNWWDDDRRCKICGKFPEEHENDLTDPNYHEYNPSLNEVVNLYERMKGLVLVQFKKDCLDLPDKIYKIIQVNPTPSILRSAQVIVNTASSTIKALTLLRELSDGFQYTKKKVGEETCPLCNGNKSIDIPDPSIYKSGEIPESGDIKFVKDACPSCNATGQIARYERTTADVICPKDEAIIDLLEDHEEYGRIVIYAGFTGSIDKLIRISNEKDWTIIRYDRQVYVQTPEGNRINDINEHLMAMDYSHPKYEELKEKYPKIALIGHPASGSEGLTLTASPSIVYYSNDFNGMYRMQSEGRIDRAGMNKAWGGAVIIDIYHLPTDKYVHDNLNKKKQLQSLSLGDVKGCLEKLK